MNGLKRGNEENNIFLEIILAIAMSIIFMLIGMYYISWFMFFYPVFFVVIGVRHGLNYNILSLLVSTLILGIMVGSVSVICILLAFGPLSIVLADGIKKRKKSFEIISISTFTLFISLLSIIIIMKGIADVNVITQLEEVFAQTINAQTKVLQDMDLSSYEISKAVDLLEDSIKYTILILPSIIMISSLVIAYLNYLISALVLRRLGYGIISIPKFSRFQLPNNILLGIGTMLLGVFILKSLKLFYYETILMNIVVLATFMFFAQGLAVIDYKLAERNMPIFLRVLLLIILIVLLPIGWVITLFGLMDIIIDFRKIRKPKKPI